jgi:hypothetical protein
MILVFPPESIRLFWKSLKFYKHTSLFKQNNEYGGKKFYSIGQLLS